jgi:hypothetical protein
MATTRILSTHLAGEIEGHSQHQVLRTRDSLLSYASRCSYMLYTRLE